MLAASGTACICTLAPSPPFPSCQKTSAPRETISLLSHLPNLYSKSLNLGGVVFTQCTGPLFFAELCVFGFSGWASYVLLIFSLHFHWRPWQDLDSALCKTLLNNNNNGNIYLEARNLLAGMLRITSCLRNGVCVYVCPAPSDVLLYFPALKV